MYEALKGEVARRKQMHKLTYVDLAKMTGYEPQTIAAFMCGARESDAVAEAITRAINDLESEV